MHTIALTRLLLNAKKIGQAKTDLEKSLLVKKLIQSKSIELKTRPTG